MDLSVFIHLPYASLSNLGSGRRFLDIYHIYRWFQSSNWYSIRVGKQSAARGDWFVHCDTCRLLQGVKRNITNIQGIYGSNPLINWKLGSKFSKSTLRERFGNYDLAEVIVSSSIEPLWRTQTKMTHRLAPSVVSRVRWRLPDPSMTLRRWRQQLSADSLRWIFYSVSKFLKNCNWIWTDENFWWLFLKEKLLQR